MIYGGPSTQLTARQHNREHREVFVVRMAVPQYLSWSSTPITFDQEDHPDKVIAPSSTHSSSTPSSSTPGSQRF